MLDIDKRLDTEEVLQPVRDKSNGFERILTHQLSKAQLESGPRRPSIVGAVRDTEGASADTNDPASGDITGFRWILVCIALYLSTFMYGLDTTIAADVQSAVVETFGSVGKLAWLGAGFPLGFIAVGLPYGSLLTHFNMKWAYISGIVLFEVGSALYGGAPNMDTLIVGRVIAGMGGSGMYLGGLTHFSALASSRTRGTYIIGIVFV